MAPTGQSTKDHTPPLGESENELKIMQRQYPQAQIIIRIWDWETFKASIFDVCISSSLAQMQILALKFFNKRARELGLQAAFSSWFVAPKELEEGLQRSLQVYNNSTISYHLAPS